MFALDLLMPALLNGSNFNRNIPQLPIFLILLGKASDAPRSQELQLQRPPKFILLHLDLNTLVFA